MDTDVGTEVSCKVTLYIMKSAASGVARAFHVLSQPPPETAVGGINRAVASAAPWLCRDGS